MYISLQLIAVLMTSPLTKTYQQFRDEVTALYGYTGLEHRWTLQDFAALLAEYANERAPGTGFRSLESYQGEGWQ